MNNKGTKKLRKSERINENKISEANQKAICNQMESKLSKEMAK